MSVIQNNQNLSIKLQEFNLVLPDEFDLDDDLLVQSRQEVERQRFIHVSDEMRDHIAIARAVARQSQQQQITSSTLITPQEFIPQSPSIIETKRESIPIEKMISLPSLATDMTSTNRYLKYILYALVIVILLLSVSILAHAQQGGVQIEVQQAGTRVKYWAAGTVRFNCSTGLTCAYSTGRLNITASGASGTVSSISVTSANGFAGTVANATTTPVITISTTITGLLKGNGTAISAAGTGTDYLAPSGSGAALVFPGLLSIASGKTATISNTLTFIGTDGSTLAIGTGGTLGSAAYTALSAYLPIGGGTLTGGLLFTDNTLDIGASGATRPRTGYFGTSVLSPLFNASTGFQISGVAAIGKILRGDGSNYVASAFTMAVPGASGNVLTSDSTNWISAAPAGGGLTIGTTTITGGVDTKSLYNNAGVVGERTVTGTGNDVLSSSPTLTGTVALPTAITVNGNAQTFPTSAATLARTDAGQTFTGVNVFTSPKILTDISDTNGNAVIGITATTSALNKVTIANAATGNSPTISTTGSNADIDINLVPKSSQSSFVRVRPGGTGVFVSIGQEVDSSAFGAIYIGSVAPAVNIYSLAGDGQRVFLNAPSTTINFSIADVIKASIATGGAIKFGGSDGSSAAVAQTLSVQGSSGNSAAAALFTLSGSDQSGTTTTGGGVKIRGGNGTSAGGTVELWTSATTTPAVAVSVAADKTTTFSGVAIISATTDSTTTTSGALQVAGGAAIRKRFFIDGITTSSGLQTAVLCQSSGGEMIADSVACLASSGRFKERVKPLVSGLNEVMQLRPVSYHYKPEGIFAHNSNFQHERVGFIAEDVARIDSRFVGYEADGTTPRTVGYDTMVPLVVKAIQEMQSEISALKAEIQKLKRK